MLKNISNYTGCLILVLLLFYNCNDKKDTRQPNSISQNKSTDSEQFLLEEDGIKIVLPLGFKRYSAVEYQDYLESNLKKEELKYENARLRQLRNMEGTLYIFFDESSNSTYTINSTPPISITDKAGKEFLEMVRSKHLEVEKITGRKYNKITAKFSDKSESKIFKAVYEVTGKSIPQSRYSHSYIITTAKRTVFINLDSPAEFDFDPYIEKMIF